MNLQQLQAFCAVSDAGFSVSAAAKSLGISQPAVSKQIRLLETHLDLELLIRHNNRIIGLSAAGQAVFAAARRTLWEAENLQRVREEFTQQGGGRLVIATTHIYARHVLRPVIQDFMHCHPDVRLVLRQGSAAMISQWLISGEADIGVSSNSDEVHDEVAFLPCAALYRSVFAPAKHPVLREKNLTLKALAKYPFIIMDTSLEGGRAVLGAFDRAGLKPNVVLSALDTEVVKSYVELGLGIAVLLSIAYERNHDRGLGVVDVAKLFPPTVPAVLLRRGGYLRGYMHDFIERLAPQWDRASVDAAIRSGVTSSAIAAE
ncbi:MAG TPA: LysR substrate-binding domain-containing protein [Pseudolabrys sp.]|jgi:LysR family cys regulon transcriptional activator